MSFRAIGALLCGCVLLFAVPASAVEKKSYQGKNVQWDQKAAAWSKSAGAGENKSYRVKKAYWTEKETGWSRSTIKLKRQNGAYPGSFPNHNYGKTRR